MATIKPKVSVLICTCNHVEYIEKCLDSILEQECDFKFEIILGEDGSNDGTQEICKEYAKRFPDVIQLKIRDQEKKVYLYGRATGKYNLLKILQEGTGEYFAFCDGDDYWTDKKKLQKQVDFMDNSPEYSFCATNIMVVKGEEIVSYERLQIALLKNSGQAIDIEKANFFSPYLVKTNTILFRRKHLDFQLLKERYTEVNDTFIYYVLLSKGKGIIQPWITSNYRIHPGGRWSSISPFNKARMSHHTIRGMYYSYLGKDLEVKSFYRDTLSRYFIASLRSQQWEDVVIALKENPSFCLKAVTTKVSQKILSYFQDVFAKSQ